MKTTSVTILKVFLLVTVFSAFAVGGLMSKVLSREDEDPQWIVDVVDSKCSKPCGGGLRKVTYKCAVYKHSSGETFSQPDHRCSGVPKPPSGKSCNLEPCFFKPGDKMQNADPKDFAFEWKSTGKWSKCINGCFAGTQCIINECWSRAQTAWVDAAKCANINKPQSICNACRKSVSCPPIWKKSEWSVCSRSCGSGVRSREVNCATQLGADHYTSVDPSKCTSEAKPHTSERCGRKDCPAEFLIGKWGPCKDANPNNCGKGKRRRGVTCLRMLKSGVVLKVPARVCMKRRLNGSRPKGFPALWMSCTDYSVKMSESCKKTRKFVLPKISTDNSTIVQMRRVRRIRLQVGETAYIFPRTALVIKCPVKDYDPRDLTWMKDGEAVNTAGKRIHMNFKGRLKIKRAKRRDAGTWECIAGPANASISIHLRYPSEGFREFAIRQPLLLERNVPGMMSDAGYKKKNKGRARKIVQWVAGSWSHCSRTCGDPGVMKRRVQCERVKANYYKVFDDARCKKMGLERPPSEKACGGLKVCPMWQVEPNKGKCTNQCLRPNFALQKDRVFCGVNNQRLPLNFCNQKSKPVGVAECVNHKCQLAWKTSPWSQCSRTCGGRGVIARQMTCVWKQTKANAGFACFKFNVQQPKAFKFCDTPKCNLECIDLTAQCATIKPALCRFAPYQRFCCKRCKNFGMEEENKEKEKE